MCFKFKDERGTNHHIPYYFFTTFVQKKLIEFEGQSDQDNLYNLGMAQII